MSVAPTHRGVPAHVRRLPLGGRIRWARQAAGLSHDKLVARLGRSNRGHLIKIERGNHVPRQDLRDAIADACGVSRELFSSDDDEEADPVDIAAALLGFVRHAVATQALHEEAKRLA